MQLGVFPENFELPLLITVYAMVILGGAGSLPGVVIGAIVINVSLELLRDPGNARLLFYGAIGLGLLALDPAVGEARGRRRRDDRSSASSPTSSPSGCGPRGSRARSRAARFADLLDGWVIHPVDSTRLGNVGFVLLIAAVITLSELRGIWRDDPARRRRSTSPRSSGRTGSSPSRA